VRLPCFLELIGKRVTTKPTTFELAEIDLLNRRQADRGVQVPEPIPVTVPGIGPTLVVAVADFLADYEKKVANGKIAPATLTVYRKAVETFRDSCRVTFLKDVTADVLEEHEDWLRTNIKRRGRGYFENSLATRFRSLKAFFTWYKMTFEDFEWPQARDTAEEARQDGVLDYSDEDVKALLAVSTEDEADLIHFAIKTGFRDMGIASAEWDDIDWDGKKRKLGVATIITKQKERSASLPQGFRTKNGKWRTVEIPSLVNRLKARRELTDRQVAAGVIPPSTLIFPNSKGTQDLALIYRLHKIVDKAAKSDGTRKAYKIRGRIGLHRFRKVYATRLLASTNNIMIVKERLGHADIETTQRYLGIDTAKATAGAQTAFSGFGD
jgi:integrase